MFAFLPIFMIMLLIRSFLAALLVLVMVVLLGCFYVDAASMKANMDATSALICLSFEILWEYSYPLLIGSGGILVVQLLVLFVWVAVFVSTLSSTAGVYSMLLFHIVAVVGVVYAV